MTEPTDFAARRIGDAQRWALSLHAAALMAVDPVGLGGVALRSPAGPLRDAWLAGLRRLMADAPWRRVPLHISDERLLGGIDLAATLQAGRPIAQRGLLAEADGGTALLAMAERLPVSALAHWAAAIDQGRVRVERDGLSLSLPTRFGVVALDEGLDGDEACAPALLDRLAFHLDLAELGPLDTGAGRSAAGAAVDGDAVDASQVEAARARLARVVASDEQLAALCTAAAALGIASLRTPLQALRAARAAAALGGRVQVSDDDVALAARLVLAPRATRLPDSAAAEAPPAEDDAAPPPPGDPAPEPPPAGADGDPPPPEPPAAEDEDDPPPPDVEALLQELVLEAARAAMPPGLLARLRAGLPAPASQRAATNAGRSGAWQAGRARGRPAGVRRGAPRAGVRLNLIETLRAAAPWQRVRQAARAAQGGAAGVARIEVRVDDFHTTRTQQRRETTTVFVVDASGSSALNRLAEAKGAVELLLAECYVRRDRVAVLGFRGRGAELLLPPTRSLVRAKRSLAGLPGGGGTPLAAGIDAAADLAEALRRRGDTAVVVLLTDGRANIARDGQPGRDRAMREATASAARLRGVPTLMVDTSPQPGEAARLLAVAMSAQYLALPYAGAAQLSQAIQLGARSLSRHR